MKVVEKLIEECEVQLINRDVEIDILNRHLVPLKTAMIQEKDKKKVEGLNAYIAQLNQDINTRKEEMEYLTEKKELLEKRKIE